MVALVGGVLVPGAADIVRFARSRGVDVKLHADLGSVRTMVEAADRSGRPVGAIGNVVLVTVRGEPLLVVVPGDRRLDGERLCRALGAKPTEVALATRDEVERITGYAPGLIPAFGHDQRLPLLVDDALLEQATVLLPTGQPDALVEIASKALIALPDVRRGNWSVAGETPD